MKITDADREAAYREARASTDLHAAWIEARTVRDAKYQEMRDWGQAYTLARQTIATQGIRNTPEVNQLCEALWAERDRLRAEWEHLLQAARDAGNTWATADQNRKDTP